MTDHEAHPFSDVRCTQCGGARLQRRDGTPGACSFIPCPAPLHDAERERECRVRFERHSDGASVECALPSGHPSAHHWEARR